MSESGLTCERCRMPMHPREATSLACFVCPECAREMAAKEELRGRELAWREATGGKEVRDDPGG